MKKPKITVSEWYPADKSTDKGITKVSVGGLDDWDIKDAYSDMIDALIEAKSIIEDVDPGFYPEEYEIVIGALKKAGVEL